MNKSKKKITIELLVPELLNNNLHDLEKKFAAKLYDPNCADSEGRTCLMQGAIDKNYELCKLLISNGADVNIKDKYSWTALHFACQGFQTDIVRLLLENGADVDPQNNFGNTPLGISLISCRGDVSLAKLLLKHGANKDIVNYSGISPFELAKTVANYNLLQAFE